MGHQRRNVFLTCDLLTKTDALGVLRKVAKAVFALQDVKSARTQKNYQFHQRAQNKPTIILSRKKKQDSFCFSDHRKQWLTQGKKAKLELPPHLPSLIRLS
jgi:hypothetical protein